MAGPYHGKAGNVDFDTGVEVVNLQSWSLNAIGETTDASAMADAWAIHLAGLTDFTATCEGLSKKALDTTVIIGTDASLDLQVDSTDGPHFEANAILASLTETVNYENHGIISYSFEGNDVAGIVFSATGGTAATGSTDAFHGKIMKAEHGAGPTEFTSIREWTITLTCSTADTTAAHATNAGRTRLAGILSATATVTCVAGAAEQVAKGTVGNLILWRTQTVGDGKYSGSSICTGGTSSVDRDGTSLRTYTFVYTSTVDLAVA